MADRSSTSSSNPRGVSSSVLWMLLWLAAAEAIARAGWRPPHISERRYEEFEPTYGYGFDGSRPVFYRIASQLRCFPSEYVDVWPQQLPPAKASDEVRVFVLGDSVSRAASPDASYAALLGPWLAARDPSRRWQVINWSASGAGTERLAVALRNALPYQPDVIVLHMHGSNEYEDELYHRSRDAAYAGWNRVLFRSHWLVISSKWFAKELGLHQVVQDRLDALAAGGEGEANQQPGAFERWNRSIDRYLADILAMARARGIPVIVLGRAERNDGADGFAGDRAKLINGVVRPRTEAEAAAYVDTARVLGEAYPRIEDKDTVFRDGSHWTPAGHRAITPAVGDEILRALSARADHASPQR